MAKIEEEHIFEGSLDQVFKGLKQFDLYSKYLPGVTSIEILPAVQKGSVCQVRYELNLIKKFFYILDMYEESPTKMWWTLTDSNLMKFNDGSWKLRETEPGKTRAKYALDVKFKGLIPGAITDQVAKANLPMMFTGFQRLINDLKSEKSTTKR